MEKQQKPGYWDFSGFYQPDRDPTPEEKVRWALDKIAKDREKTEVGSETLQPTLEEITVYDPTFAGQVTIHPSDLKPEEIQIDIGGYWSGKPYSISIITDPREYNTKKDLYEISVNFNGKLLSELGFWSEDILNALSLRAALRIAKAVVSKDEQKLNDALLKAYDKKAA